MAPLGAFDGVWQLTGGLITVQKPPMTIEIGDADFAEWGLKPPIYIGICDGVVVTCNQGQPLSKDPSLYDLRLQSYYAGNALYVGVQSLGVTAVLYYVSPGVHHLKHPAGVEPEFGIDTVFTLYTTDLDSVPPSDSEDPDLPFTLMPPPPKP